MSEAREPKSLSIEQIEAIIPQRYPFLLIDRVIDHEPGSWAKGIKCVSANEAFFAGHFPQQKVMPGVLMIEALAQLGAVLLLSVPEDQGKLAMFSGIRQARFMRSVVPGDVLTLACEITRRKGFVGIGNGVASVNGETVCDAELVFAIR